MSDILNRLLKKGMVTGAISRSQYATVQKDLKSNDFSSSINTSAENTLINAICSGGRTVDVDDRAVSPKVHVSSAIKSEYCFLKHRKNVELGINASKEDLLSKFRKSVEFSTHLVWSMGRLCEDSIRSSILTSDKGSHVLGKYSCRCGASSYVGDYDRSHDSCLLCNTKVDKYLELPIEVGAISGSPDIIMRLPTYSDSGNSVEWKYTVVEIKSQNAKDFDANTPPTLDNKLQVMTYLYLLRYLRDLKKDEDFYGIPFSEFNLDTAIVLQISKGYRFKSTETLRSTQVSDKDLTDHTRLNTAEVIIKLSSMDSILDYDSKLGVAHKVDNSSGDVTYSPDHPACLGCLHIDTCSAITSIIESNLLGDMVV